VRVVHVHRIRGIGGSERHLLELLPALAGLGLEPVFVGLDDPSWDPAPFYAELAAAGVQSKRLRAPRDVDPRLLLSLARTLRRLKPDLVHTHLVHADVYGALTKRGRLVSTKHNDDRFRTGPFRFLERMLTRRADRVIAITHALARFSVERVGLPPEKIDVVPYGLDAPPPPWGENPPSAVPDRARVLLAVTRLVEQKGVDRAVAALPAIRSVHGDVVLVVLGEGPERSRLERLARDLSVTEALFLLGRVPDVATWLRRAQVLVHPARWEGFGLALLEAMLASVPIVATSVSSIPELVVHRETGLLVRPDGLAAAVNRLLDNPAESRRLARAALARAKREFSVERMAHLTAAVYDSALSSER
jgi:glycosyltransferase involved in cell wall biosynthesis